MHPLHDTKGRGIVVLLIAGAFVALLLLSGMAEATERPTEPCDAHGQSCSLPSLERHAACCLIDTVTTDWMRSCVPAASTHPEAQKVVVLQAPVTVFRI